MLDESPSLSPPRAGLRLLTPDAEMVVGETWRVCLYPPAASVFDLRVRQRGRGELLRRAVEDTRFDWGEELEPGQYLLDARWSEDGDAWSQWSLPLTVRVHRVATAEVERLRRQSHLLSLQIERDLLGVVTATDPQGTPANGLGEGAEWFPTHVFEGATSVFNETASYYASPLDYYLEALRSLIRRGARFVTWHDLLDEKAERLDAEDLSVLLQLDVDAGLESVARLVPPMIGLGVRASLMVHAEAAPWYEYSLAEQPLDTYRLAQSQGWTVGYHCNALGRARYELGSRADAVETLSRAQQLFGDDVRSLRASGLDVRTTTAHGGNVLNLNVPIPAGADVVSVDRSNEALWSSIRSMFSDGGFVSRPGPFAETMEGLTPGLHFVRNHPFKYGNYRAPHDLPPASEADPECARRQSAWLEERRSERLQWRLGRGHESKPLSSGFRPFSEVRERVEALRAQRRPFFLREYPHALGDPRVFWWRLLECSVAAPARAVNVGALPPAMRVEHEAFLAGVEVLELDLDPLREPHVLADAAEPPDELLGSFDVALLFGLPYFSDPGAALDGCRRLCRSEGLGLFGFPDDTHPMRGGLWNPETRPVWRAGSEPIEDPGLRGRLWSFDDRSLDDLFADWRDVEIENLSHYWFVRART
ncbi:MAG: hypothetical protein AAF690_07915 [Acidobacteriota bacterium]